MEIPVSNLTILINERLTKLRNDYEADYDIIEEANEVQNETEARMLQKLPICTLNHGLRINLSSIKVEKLKEILEDEFDNPGILKILYCITNAIIVPPMPDSQIVNQMRIRHWLTKLKTLSEGCYGETFESALKEGSRKFVIKVQNRLHDFTLTHELFVGLFGTNRLRELGNLNFSYVYGGFSCTHPIRMPGSDTPITWCNKPYNLQYIIYEKINGPCVTDYLAQCNGVEYLNILVQLTLALSEAYKKINYIHYDLHPDNVVLRSIPKLQIAYGPIYLWTDKIATIIDYGMSYFIYENKAFGSPVGFKAEVRADKDFRVYDIFKFLIYSWKSATPVLRTTIAECLQFFTTQNPEQIIQNAKNNNTTIWLPRVKNFTNLSLDDFWNFLSRHWGNKINFIQSKPDFDRLLGCNLKNCLSDIELLDQISGDVVPTDPFEFLDLCTYLIDKGKNVELEKLIADYSSDTGYNIIKTRYQFYFDRLEKNESSLNVIDIGNATLTEICDPVVIEKYLHYLFSVADIIESMDNLVLLKEILDFFVEIYPKYNNLDWKFLNKSGEKITKQLKKINQEYQFLKKYSYDNHVNSLLKTMQWFSILYKAK